MFRMQIKETVRRKKEKAPKQELPIHVHLIYGQRHEATAIFESAVP